MLKNSPGLMLRLRRSRTGRTSFLTVYCLLTSRMSMTADWLMTEFPNFLLSETERDSRAPHTPAQEIRLGARRYGVETKADEPHDNDAEQHLVHRQRLAPVDHQITDARARSEQVFRAKRAQPRVN